MHASRTCVMVLGLLGLLASAASAQNRARWPLPTPAVPDSLGVNIHFTDPRPGEMEQLAAAGFRWIRMDFTWAGIERTRGIYDFAAYDRLMAALTPHRIRPIFILDYGNGLYQQGSPREDASREAFARFAAAAVRHFKDQGILWEMWNEPNGGFWQPKADVDQYIALALATGKAIRQAAPEEWYIGPATSGMDFTFIEKCFQAGLLNYWDAVSFHPYRNSPPETAQPDFTRVRALIDQYAPRGKKIPILSGEWGYSERYPGLNLQKQSQYIAREFLSDLASGLIISIWYDWHDDGLDPKEIEHHFGTVYNDYKPKPTYQAAQTLAQTLNGLRFNKRLALASPNDYCLLFSQGKNVRLAAWTTDPSPHEAILPTGGGKFQVVAYTGEKSEATAKDQGLRLTLSGSPQYVIPEGTNPFLTLVAQWPTVPRILTLTGARADLQPLLASGGETAGLPRNCRLMLEEVETVDTPMGQVRPLLTARQEGKGRFVATDTGDVMALLQDRSDQAHRLRITLIVPGGGTVAQETLAFARDPLRLTPLPAISGVLPVRVENPSGTPFLGRIRPVGAPEATAQVVHFVEGEKEAIFRFPVEAGASGDYTAQFELEEQKHGAPVPVAVLTTPRLAYTALESFASYADGSTPPADHYRVEPDGDPKVKSQITWEVVVPPMGLPILAEKAARIDYDFDPGWKFLRLSPQGAERAPLPGEPATLGMWVYGDGSGDILNARYTDSTGQTFQPTAGRIDWKGWRYVTFSLRGVGGHWSGAEDGVVHYPIHLDTVLLVDSPGGRGGKGVVYMTGMTLIHQK